MSLRAVNPVLALLIATMVVAAFAFGFVTVAPNRILSGRPVSLWDAADGDLRAALSLWVATFVLTALVPTRGANWMVAGLAGALVVATVHMAGMTASDAMRAVGTPAARVSLGAGFWLIVLAAALALADALARLQARAWLRFAAALAIAAAIAVLARSGWLDDLSLMREFANRRDSFAAELGRHAMLVAASLAPAMILGAALGLAASRGGGEMIFAALNIAQTIPSIALFALLIAPLSGLSETFPVLRDWGLRGIGAAPAVIALALYGLLPVARAVHAGFAGVPAPVLDAAAGMGMSGWQILRDVRLPLALPVLLSGLRIVTIQLIGLAVVAALIGAGGLGTFVFQGLGQTATDLVLLGALSAIALALLVDGLLRSLSDLVVRA